MDITPEFIMKDLDLEMWQAFEDEDLSGKKGVIPSCNKCECIFVPGFDPDSVLRFMSPYLTDPGHDCNCHELPTWKIRALVMQGNTTETSMPQPIDPTPKPAYLPEGTVFLMANWLKDHGHHSIAQWASLHGYVKDFSINSGWRDLDHTPVDLHSELIQYISMEERAAAADKPIDPFVEAVSGNEVDPDDVEVVPVVAAMTPGQWRALWQEVNGSSQAEAEIATDTVISVMSEAGLTSEHHVIQSAMEIGFRLARQEMRNHLNGD